MTKPYALIDIDLSQPLQALQDLGDYVGVRGLVLWAGTALGEVELSLQDGRCSVEQQSEAIATHFSEQILRQALIHSLASGQWTANITWLELLKLASSADVSNSPAINQVPSISLALCWAAASSAVTREQLQASLAALEQARQRCNQPIELELLVLGPQSLDSEIQQVLDSFQQSLNLKYLSSADGSAKDLPTESRSAIAASPLQQQYQQALDMAEGEIVTFLSPQVQVGPDWLGAIAQQFADHAELTLMTGPLLEAHQTTEASETLRQQNLASPGFYSSWYRQTDSQAERWKQVYFDHPLPIQNLAVRKAAFVCRDAGSQLIKQGVHRWAFDQIHQGNSLCNHPQMWAREASAQSFEQRLQQTQTDSLQLSRYFAWGWLNPELPQGYRHIFLKESLGSLRWNGKCRLQHQGQAKAFYEAKFDSFSTGLQQALMRQGPVRVSRQAVAAAAEAVASSKDSRRMASRTVDLARPLPHWTDLQDYSGVRIFVTDGQTLLGSVDLWHYGGSICPLQISQVIVHGLGERLLSNASEGHSLAWEALKTQLAQWLQPQIEEADPEEPEVIAGLLPLTVPVSVIITTCDRPDDLRNCLRHLLAQESDRELEIIVADNRPASGITPTVVAEFPGVRLVSEARVGGSYGRNSAFCASTGDIVITVDDDVTVPSDWLEKLLAPMVRPEVMAVTGNVLPGELETEAQRMYEDLYGGLGEGLEQVEADGCWLASFNYSPPVWDLGVSANSAFRASIFHHPEIGMMPEALGPGTPVGGGEENYLVYRILKAGGTLVYEPSAYAWHRHRRTIPELRYQIYRQMMGGTAYHLRLWTVDGDLRAKQQLLTGLPNYFMGRLMERARGEHQVPWRFLAAEIAGYAMGFWGYWRSLKAVERQGLSDPYIPVSQRSMSLDSEQVSAPSAQQSSGVMVGVGPGSDRS